GDLVLAHVAPRDGLADGAFRLFVNRRTAQLDPVGPRTVEPSVYALHDHVALELRKGARDSKEALALGRCRIEHLRVDEEVHLAGLKVPDGVQEVGERAPDAVECERHHRIESAAVSIAKHPIEFGTILTAFYAADALVAVGGDDLPSAVVC